MEDEISRLVNSRKQLEADASLKKKNVMEKRKDLQKIQGEKKTINTPLSAEIENILLLSTTFQQLPTMVVSLMVSTVVNSFI